MSLLSGVVPEQVELIVGGESDSPVPVHVTIGDKVFMLGIGLIAVLVIVGARSKR